MPDSDVEARKRKFEQDPELDHKLAIWIRTILREEYKMEVVKTEKKTEKKQGGKVNARQRH